MYYKAITIFGTPGRYKLLGHQCDNVAGEILYAGGIQYFVYPSPNGSYDEIIKYSDRSWSRKK